MKARDIRSNVVGTFLHTSAYVSIRQHTSAYVSIRQHTSANGVLVEVEIEPVLEFLLEA